MHKYQRNKLFEKYKLWSKAVRTLDTKLQVYSAYLRWGNQEVCLHHLVFSETHRDG
jgi:hypothetical protein